MDHKPPPMRYSLASKSFWKPEGSTDWRRSSGPCSLTIKVNGKVGSKSTIKRMKWKIQTEGNAKVDPAIKPNGKVKWKSGHGNQTNRKSRSNNQSKHQTKGKSRSRFSNQTEWKSQMKKSIQNQQSNQFVNLIRINDKTKPNGKVEPTIKVMGKVEPTMKPNEEVDPESTMKPNGKIDPTKKKSIQNQQ